MNTTKKRVILVEADLNAQLQFKAQFAKSEVEVTAFTSGMGAIQYIKQNGIPELLVLEEAAKPLGAVQTLNYLKDQIGFSAPVIVVANHIHSGLDKLRVQKIITRPYRNADIQFIKELLMLDAIIKNPSSQAYNLDYLMELADGDDTFIQESLKIFLTSVPAQVHALVESFEENRLEAVCQYAHAIKPSYEMLQSKRAAKLCDTIAHYAQPQELPSLVKALKKEHETIEYALLQDFPELLNGKKCNN